MSTEKDDLNLPVGAILQIQATVPDHSPRLSVQLIGYLTGSSLVVTTPVVGGKVQIVREGQRFNVRLLMGERIVGFVAQVLHVGLKPYAHLHLQYPEEFEQIVVRDGSRVNADIAVTVRNTVDENKPENFREARIVDLSETGAKLTGPAPFGKVDEMLHIRFELTVGRYAEELTLLGDIRSEGQRPQSEGLPAVYYTGIRFRSLNRYQQLLLYAWVTNRVLEDAMQTH